MAETITEKPQLKTWWVTGSKPTQAQYYLWMDAYWHKSELISMSNIKDLALTLGNKADADQLQFYAQTDANNIEVEIWRDKLGVGDSLPPNIGTIDFNDSEGFSYIGNAYKKVETPDDDNIYVLNIDGTAVNANTFGKNVMNSSNSTTGSYVQTQSVGDSWEFKTQGQDFKISGLIDKTVDAAFTEFVGSNSSGRMAKVGFPAFKANIQNWTPEQALEFSQLLNAGQGSAGLISVNTISPPLFERENNNVYLVLRGANLYLNNVAFSVHIVRASDNAIVAQVPNSQVQLYTDGLSLVFWYNFYALGVGDYKIRLTSGVKTLVTSLQFKIVSSIQNINISAITWNKLINPAIITTDASVGSGGNITAVDNQNTQSTAIPAISFLSSELFAQGDDWYVELQVAIGTKKPNYHIPMSRIGICYSNTVNELAFIPIHFFQYGKYGNVLVTQVNTTPSFLEFPNEGSSGVTRVLSITKIGNNLTITDGKQVGVMTISNNSGYSIAAQLTAITTSTPQDGITEGLSVTILKAFKII